METDWYILAIVALLPLTAFLLVFQTNPYHALVIRGILGAVAALVYALFGAADVALTEALVGTMLSITLYAVAVRSSLNFRIGILSTSASPTIDKSSPQDASQVGSQAASEDVQTTVQSHPSEELRAALRSAVRRHHLRIEWVPYPSHQSLKTALATKDVHAICTLSAWGNRGEQETHKDDPSRQALAYSLQTRIHRLYQILQAELPEALAQLTYVDVANPSLKPKEVDQHNPA